VRSSADHLGKILVPAYRLSAGHFKENLTGGAARQISGGVWEGRRNLSPVWGMGLPPEKLKINVEIARFRHKNVQLRR